MDVTKLIYTNGCESPLVLSASHGRILFEHFTAFAAWNCFDLMPAQWYAGGWISPQGAFGTIQGSYKWPRKMRFQNHPAEAKCSRLYLHYIDITWGVGNLVFVCYPQHCVNVEIYHGKVCFFFKFNWDILDTYKRKDNQRKGVCPILQ